MTAFMNTKALCKYLKRLLNKFDPRERLTIVTSWYSFCLCLIVQSELATGPKLISNHKLQQETMSLINTFDCIVRNLASDPGTPQPWEIFFNTMKYRSSETVQRSGHFQSRVSYIKRQNNV